MGTELASSVDFDSWWLQRSQLVLVDVAVDVAVAGTSYCLGDSMGVDMQPQLMIVVAMGYVATILTFVVPLESLLLLKLLLVLAF